jgi:hypothetical protein
MLELVAACPTPHEVWENLVTMSSSQSRGRVINTRMALSTTRKGNLSVAQYVGKMKTLMDDMASAGKKLEDEDLVSYILVGLDSDFDSITSAVSARVEPISVAELYGQLVFHEQRHELHGKVYTMANAAARGHGSSLPARDGHSAPSHGRGGPRCGCGRNNDQMPLALSASFVAGRDIPSRGAGSGLINPSLEKKRVHLQHYTL